MGTPTDDELRDRLADKNVDPVITEIRFPLYKALSPNLTITFSFPITALVGPNGSNKSSILHALYGAPSGKSLSDFWFSTAMDNIDDFTRPRANESTLQRFIYKYRIHVDGEEVTGECRKVRGSRRYRLADVPRALAEKKDPDYWETTKRVEVDKMAEMPVDDSRLKHLLSDSGDRWNPVPKEVVYLDFRSELSAYDKFRYHAATDKWTARPNGKKFRIIDRAEGLARAFASQPYAKDDPKILDPVRNLAPPLGERNFSHPRQGILVHQGREAPILFVSRLLGKNEARRWGVLRSTRRQRRIRHCETR